jgi:hypothetical protein
MSKNRYHESMGSIGDAPGVRERLGAVRGLLSDGEQLGRPRGVLGASEDPNSIAGMFAQEGELAEASFPKKFTQPHQPKVVDAAYRGVKGLVMVLTKANVSVDKFLGWVQGQTKGTELIRVMEPRLMSIMNHVMSATGEAVQLRDDLKELEAKSKRFAGGPKYSERPR